MSFFICDLGYLTLVRLELEADEVVAAESVVDSGVATLQVNLFLEHLLVALASS